MKQTKSQHRFRIQDGGGREGCDWSIASSFIMAVCYSA